MPDFPQIHGNNGTVNEQREIRNMYLKTQEYGRRVDYFSVLKVTAVKFVFNHIMAGNKKM